MRVVHSISRTQREIHRPHKSEPLLPLLISPILDKVRSLTLIPALHEDTRLRPIAFLRIAVHMPKHRRPGGHIGLDSSHVLSVNTEPEHRRGRLVAVDKRHRVDARRDGSCVAVPADSLPDGVRVADGRGYPLGLRGLRLREEVEPLPVDFDLCVDRLQRTGRWCGGVAAPLAAFRAAGSGWGTWNVHDPKYRGVEMPSMGKRALRIAS